TDQCGPRVIQRFRAAVDVALRGGPQSPAPLVELLLAIGKPPFAGISEHLAFVGDPVPLVGGLLTLVGLIIPAVGRAVTDVGGLIPSVGVVLPLGNPMVKRYECVFTLARPRFVTV